MEHSQEQIDSFHEAVLELTLRVVGYFSGPGLRVNPNLIKRAFETRSDFMEGYDRQPPAPFTNARDSVMAVRDAAADVLRRIVNKLESANGHEFIGQFVFVTNVDRRSEYATQLIDFLRSAAAVISTRPADNSLQLDSFMHQRIRARLICDWDPSAIANYDNAGITGKMNKFTSRAPV